MAIFHAEVSTKLDDQLRTVIETRYSVPYDPGRPESGCEMPPVRLGFQRRSCDILLRDDGSAGVVILDVERT